MSQDGVQELTELNPDAISVRSVYDGPEQIFPGFKEEQRVEPEDLLRALVQIGEMRIEKASQVREAHREEKDEFFQKTANLRLDDLPQSAVSSLIDIEGNPLPVDRPYPGEKTPCKPLTEIFVEVKDLLAGYTSGDQQTRADIKGFFAQYIQEYKRAIRRFGSKDTWLSSKERAEAWLKCFKSANEAIPTKPVLI